VSIFEPINKYFRDDMGELLGLRREGPDPLREDAGFTDLHVELVVDIEQGAGVEGGIACSIPPRTRTRTRPARRSRGR